MKIKLDENIPAALGQILGNLGHDVETVITEKLVGCSDSQIWIRLSKKVDFLLPRILIFQISVFLNPADIMEYC